MKRIFCSLVFLISLTGLGAYTENPDWERSLKEGEKRFQSALENDLNREHLSGALSFYMDALDQDAPERWEIYYNMGNIYSLLEEKGLAVYSYAKAASLHPGKRILIENYQILTGRDREDSSERIKRFLWGSIYLLGYKTSLFWGILLYIFSWILLAFNRLLRKKVPRLLGIVFLIISLWNTVLCLSWSYGNSRTGVILVEDPRMYRGDSRAYEQLSSINLKEGALFRLLEERAGWSYIKLSDGTAGWIENSGLKMLKPD